MFTFCDVELDIIYLDKRIKKHVTVIRSWVLVFDQRTKRISNGV